MCSVSEVARQSRISENAELPSHRLSDVPLFTNCGIDMFGPFIIKQRGNEVKRYGAIFSCIENRSVHIDIGRSQDKNSFIQAIRRVIAY